MKRKIGLKSKIKIDEKNISNNLFQNGIREGLNFMTFNRLIVG